MTLLADYAPALPWIEVTHGRAQFAQIAAEFEDFARGHGAPVSARTAWTKAALDAVGTTEPLGVFVRGESGALVAGVLLLVVPGPGIDTIVPSGGLDHRAAVIVDDVAAGLALGDALAEVLSRRPRPTFLRLGPVPSDCAALAAMVEAIPGARAVPVEPVPVVRRTDTTHVEDYLSHGTRRGLRRGANRLAADGLVAEVAFTTDPDDVLRLAPSMEQACRDRDHAHGRVSPLDDMIGRALWQRRLQLLVAADMVELAVLTLNGELASYVLGVLDGDVYRVLEGRFVTAFKRYSPGRLLEAAVLQRVLDDPALTTLDWMTSIASDTLLGTNGSDPMVVVEAEVQGRRLSTATAVFDLSGSW